jgi:structural maintenance of chromosome 2
MNNYDKKRVHGKVLELIELKEDAYMRAIEMGAGPKLMNIVVDDEETSTYMLKNNIIGQHNYYIPNSKVTSFQPNEDIIKVAE